MIAHHSAPVPFGRQWIGAEYPVLLISEIGINHEGDEATCARMIEQSARAGADAVKLQTIDAAANYAAGTASFELFSRAWLDAEATTRMFDYARYLGMEVFTTVGDQETLDWVDRLNPAAHKISSGLLTHLPMVRAMARTSRSLLISTGMASNWQIGNTLEAAEQAGADDLALFQCTSIYPAPPDSINLRAIGGLAARFGRPTGFSDHSLGIAAAPLAVAAGAVMIEKHFSYDTSRLGFDHGISLDENSFAEMVQKVRAAETMLGVEDPPLREEEAEKAKIMHRCLVAARPIADDEILSADNIAIKRPVLGGLGLPPSTFERVLGHQASRALNVDDPIGPTEIQGWSGFEEASS